MTTAPIEERLREPCPHCDDSGWRGLYGGGIWTGEGVTIRQEICDCPCGEDVCRELAARTALGDQQGNQEGEV